MLGQLAVDDVFVAEPHGRDFVALHRLEVAEIRAHRRHCHAGRRAIDSLHDVRAVARHERLLFAQEEHARIHVANALHLERRFVGREQVGHLVGDRHVERVDFDGALPLANLIARRRRQIDGSQLRGAIGACLPQRRLGRIRHTVLVEATGGGKAPRAVNERSHTKPVSVGIAHALHDAVARVHVLLAARRHTHVGVRGTAALGGIDGHLHERLDGRIIGVRQLRKRRNDPRRIGQQRTRCHEGTGGNGGAGLEKVSA